jgi:AcrR family transcriptional regulator
MAAERIVARSRHGGVEGDNVVALVATPTSQRERAKRDRRRRIVEAAHDLLREVGMDDLSGKMIAARAGVSLSTVYNLFGSKDAVLVAVFDQDLARYEALIAAMPAESALARLFQAVDVAAGLYEEDPAFYRAAMWRRPAPALAVDAAMRRPRARFWQGLVEEALADGQLRAGTDATLLTALLIRQFSAALWEWIAEEIGLEAFRLEVKLGFCVCLLPFASRGEAPRLRTRLSGLQDVLAEVRSDQQGRTEREGEA